MYGPQPQQPPIALMFALFGCCIFLIVAGYIYQLTITCDEDEHVEDGECVACPSGETRDAGDSPMDGDTSCEPSLTNLQLPVGGGVGGVTECQVNQYAVVGTCLPCPTGHKNESRDPITSLTSSCDICDVGYHVSGNLCVQCPPLANTTTEGGTASTPPHVLTAGGSDTTCELCKDGFRWTLTTSDDGATTTGSCTRCPTGSSSTGLLASGVEESNCTCDNNKYWDSPTNTCMDCEAGLTSSGLIASGDTSSCSATPAAPGTTPGDTTPGDTTPGGDVDCVGTWSACTSDCETAAERTWVMTTSPSGDGSPCPAAGTGEDCVAGDGDCQAAEIVTHALVTTDENCPAGKYSLGAFLGCDDCESRQQGKTESLPSPKSSPYNYNDVCYRMCMADEYVSSSGDCFGCLAGTVSSDDEFDPRADAAALSHTREQQCNKCKKDYYIDPNYQQAGRLSPCVTCGEDECVPTDEAVVSATATGDPTAADTTCSNALTGEGEEERSIACAGVRYGTVSSACIYQPAMKNKHSLAIDESKNSIPFEIYSASETLNDIGSENCKRYCLDTQYVSCKRESSGSPDVWTCRCSNCEDGRSFKGDHSLKALQDYEGDHVPGTGPPINMYLPGVNSEGGVVPAAGAEADLRCSISCGTAHGADPSNSGAAPDNFTEWDDRENSCSPYCLSTKLIQDIRSIDEEWNNSPCKTDPSECHSVEIELREFITRIDEIRRCGTDSADSLLSTDNDNFINGTRGEIAERLGSQPCSNNYRFINDTDLEDFEKCVLCPEGQIGVPDSVWNNYKVEIESGATPTPLSWGDTGRSGLAAAGISSTVCRRAPCGDTERLIFRNSDPQAISAIDVATNTVTLSVADDTIVSGSIVHLENADGEVCNIEPKNTPLIVAENNGSVLTLEDGTLLTGTGSTNCVIKRPGECVSCPRIEDNPICLGDFDGDGAPCEEGVHGCKNNSGNCEYNSSGSQNDMIGLPIKESVDGDIVTYRYPDAHYISPDKATTDDNTYCHIREFDESGTPSGSQCSSVASSSSQSLDELCGENYSSRGEEKCLTVPCLTNANGTFKVGHSDHDICCVPRERCEEAGQIWEGTFTVGNDGFELQLEDSSTAPETYVGKRIELISDGITIGSGIVESVDSSGKIKNIDGWDAPNNMTGNPPWYRSSWSPGPENPNDFYLSQEKQMCFSDHPASGNATDCSETVYDDDGTELNPLTSAACRAQPRDCVVWMSRSPPVCGCKNPLSAKDWGTTKTFKVYDDICPIGYKTKDDGGMCAGAVCDIGTTESPGVDFPTCCENSEIGYIVSKDRTCEFNIGGSPPVTLELDNVYASEGRSATAADVEVDATYGVHQNLDALQAGNIDCKRAINWIRDEHELGRDSPLFVDPSFNSGVPWDQTNDFNSPQGCWWLDKGAGHAHSNKVFYNNRVDGTLTGSSDSKKAICKGLLSDINRIHTSETYNWDCATATSKWSLGPILGCKYSSCGALDLGECPTHSTADYDLGCCQSQCLTRAQNEGQHVPYSRTITGQRDKVGTGSDCTAPNLNGFCGRPHINDCR